MCVCVYVRVCVCVCVCVWQRETLCKLGLFKKFLFVYFCRSVDLHEQDVLIENDTGTELQPVVLFFNKKKFFLIYTYV